MSDKAPEETKEGVVNNYITNNIKKESFSVDWDQVTWAAAALGAAAVVIVVAMSIASFNTNRNEKMAEAIKNGSHPMDAYCAFDGGSENKVCLVRAAISNKEVK